MNVSRNEHAILWWDATYCWAGDQEPETMTGSLAAIKTWAAMVEKRHRIRRSVFKTPGFVRDDSDFKQWGTGYWYLQLVPHKFAPDEKPPVEALGDDGTVYPTWEDLVADRSNGYVAVVIITQGKKTWPWVLGPYPDKAEAKRALARQKTRCKRDQKDGRYLNQTYHFAVRPAWKDPRNK